MNPKLQSLYSLKFNPFRPDVPVVVSSGYSESETMRLFEGQRVTAFLQKPYTSGRLSEVVAATLA